MEKDKRRHSRRLLRIEARYQDSAGRMLKGTASNVSISGVFIETRNPLAVSERLKLALDAHDVGKVIHILGTVVRVEQGRGMAVEFAEQGSREIRLLISAIRKLEQASLLALSRSALMD